MTDIMREEFERWYKNDDPEKKDMAWWAWRQSRATLGRELIDKLEKMQKRDPYYNGDWFAGYNEAIERTMVFIQQHMGKTIAQ